MLEKITWEKTLVDIFELNVRINNYSSFLVDTAQPRQPPLASFSQIMSHLPASNKTSQITTIWSYSFHVPHFFVFFRRHQNWMLQAVGLQLLKCKTYNHAYRMQPCHMALTGTMMSRMPPPASSQSPSMYLYPFLLASVATPSVEKVIVIATTYHRGRFPAHQKVGIPL